MSDATFYTWEKMYAYLGMSKLRHFRQWEKETSRLKRLVANRSLDKQVLSEALQKILRFAWRRKLAHWFRDRFSVSCARACYLAQCGRASWYRKCRAKDQAALRLRIRDLAHARLRVGYQQIWVLLRREGWVVNRKRVRRLYRLDGLQFRMRALRREHIARGGSGNSDRVLSGRLASPKPPAGDEPAERGNEKNTMDSRGHG